ncbi:MAG: tetratricopeptide repeat protein [Ferruginibacter sp.]
MKTAKFIIAVFLLMQGCFPPSRVLTYMVSTRPVYTLQPVPQKIIFLNSYDIHAKKFRENKEAMFISLADNLLDSAAKRVHQKTGIATEPVFGFTNLTGNADSLIRLLLLQKNATHAIVINSLDVYFSQTHVEVTKDPSLSSKKREAFYDIISDIRFSLYNNDSMIKKIDMLTARYHSSRTVISGLLAAGPNIVVNEKDALSICSDNLQDYLNYYFAGQKSRTRTLLTYDKGFESMIAAVDRMDYDAALAAAKQLTAVPDRYKAAVACYNCAIFYEMRSQIPEALDYLRLALKNYPLQPAIEMKKELEP